MKNIGFIRTVLLLLIFALATPALAGCEDVSNGEETVTNVEDTDEIVELKMLFDMIRKDAEIDEKIEFFVSNEEKYYEVKNSGLYENSRWTPSAFRFIIICNYDAAVEEEWYKQCPDADRKALNTAFYNHIESDLLKEEYQGLAFDSGALLSYYSADDFCVDYPTITSLTDLEYVTRIVISYHFALPYDIYSHG